MTPDERTRVDTQQQVTIPPPAEKKRWPLWMYVVGLSYLATFGFIFYLIFQGPAEPRGMVATFSGGAMVIQTVDANSQIATSGLRGGDQVLMIDDLPIRTVRDWTAATGNFEVGRPQQWVVSRGGVRVQLEIIPTGVNVQTRLAEGYVQYLSLVLPGAILGFLIAWRRPADPVGRLGAWFILTTAIAFGFPVGWAVPWRQVPLAMQLMLWIPQLSRFVIEAIFLSFFLVFPRRLTIPRWVWFAIWIPVLATLPFRVQSFYAVIQPGQVAPAPTWILTAGFVRTMLYLVIGIGILVVSYRRFLDTNEKRRVRVLMLGTSANLIAAIALVWLDTFTGRLSGMNVVLYVISPFLCSCPVSLAYAVLRHRVLDIHVIIRQGLQYALARGAVIGLVPALGVILVIDLALNSQQPLATVMQRFLSRTLQCAASASRCSRRNSRVTQF